MQTLPRTGEPVLGAGYTITERIGAGGYGEVWKAIAPGGLEKAVKFVYGYLNDQRAASELKALNRIKEVRHPFLLSLERIEAVEGQLVIVTELAEASLKDRFDACRDMGLDGIPRDELLVYLADAADALDYMSEKYGLQHLDVKPENLLIVGGRAKVADFGLVKPLQDSRASLPGGLTPIYASPELFDGRPSRHSDQYSLAIVYQHMLTGTLPFPGTTAAQLAAQHLYARPLLELPTAAECNAVGRALEKDPEVRHANCRALIESLLNSDRSTALRSASVDDASQAIHDTASATVQLTSAMDKPPLGGRSAAAERTPIAPKPMLAETLARVTLLPPLAETELQLPCGPTAVVAVGGAARRVLQAYGARLMAEPAEVDVADAYRLLAIDTDRQALAARADGTAALALTQTLALPLRRPQEYRSRSARLLPWLSRRWLYNIPRSLDTEGLRPLGRLALVDHANDLLARLRQTFANWPGHMTVEAAAPPRVFVLASISSGSGGGMVLDLAYAIRQTLAELGIGNARLTGLLMHSTRTASDQHELAVANACACLRELAHYGNGGYPGDASARLAADARPPFDSTYLLHLGDRLGEGEFGRQLDRVARYLLLNSQGPAGRFFEACRRLAADDAAAGTRLRTAALETVDIVAGDQVEIAADDASAPPLASEAWQELKRPPLVGHCGGMLRVAAICSDQAPDDELARVLAATGACPALRQGKDASPLVCFEAENIAIHAAASFIAAGRRDLLEAAARLQTRTDVAYQALW